MRIPISQIDAFSRRPFAGNPAAVCILDPDNHTLTDQQMQSIAAEMNLSETAFVSWRPAGSCSLRWFTPATEVDLCGHATLASAFALWEDGLVDWNQSIQFETRSGILECRASLDSNGQREIQLDFPALPWQEIPTPSALEAALQVQAVRVVQSRMDMLVQVASESMVRQAEPVMAELARFPARGIILTAAADSPDLDFVSRFFGPAVAVPEDPVTGSAHCLLGPFWQQQLGKSQFRAHQASARGGDLRVNVVGDRVHLFGSAVRILKGELLLP